MSRTRLIHGRWPRGRNTFWVVGEMSMDLISPAIRSYESGIEADERYPRDRKYLVLHEQDVAGVRTAHRNTRSRIQRKMRSASRKIYRQTSVKPEDTGKLLFAPHFQEDIPDFFSHFQERVERATIWWDTFSFKVVFLERRSFPRSPTHQ